MISEAEYIFFAAFAGLSVVVVLALLKVQSTEPVTITTAEFKTFQYHYLVGYMTVMMGEVLCVASFFHILSSMELSFHDITELYVASVAATTFFGVAAEVVDVGSRRDKCIATTILFAVATFSLFSGGNMEILLIGRCLYGAGSVLLHSAFDSYLVNDHASQGFPDDWLLNTFSKVAHGMTIVAISSGLVGQSVSSIFGPFGVAIISILFFIGISIFILNSWNRDVGSGTKFMFSSFTQSLGQTVRSLRSNSQMLYVVCVSVATEATILVFTFYWAPLLSSAFAESVALTSHSSSNAMIQDFHTAQSSSGGTGDVLPEKAVDPESAVRMLADTLASAPSTETIVATSIPYILIYATFMISTMLGNYLYTLSISKYGNDAVFQAVLTMSAAAYFIAATGASPQIVFIAAIVIQICTGGYWPSIGWLRGRYFLPEVRGIAITLTRILTLCIVAPLLWTFHNSFMMTLLICSALNAFAVYFQFRITQTELKLQGETEEYEKHDDEI